MRSLEHQLQISLAIVLAIILTILLIVANLSSRNIPDSFVSHHLMLEAKNLQDNLFIDSGELKVKWHHLNTIYNTPYSGHYYAARFKNKKNHSVLRSLSLENNDLFLPSIQSATTTHKILGPKEQYLVVWSEPIVLNQQDVILSVAEDMSVLKEKHQQFRILFISMSIVGFIIILVLQRIVIHRLFKYLEHSRQEIKAIESDKCQQLSEDVPSEIYPLVKEFNHSLELMQQRMERSRNSLGNLAHALKTPLSILIQQLEIDNSHDKALQQKALSQAKVQAKRIQQLTERELKRARMAGLGNTAQRFNPHEELPVLIDVLKQAHNNKHLVVNLQIASNIDNFGDREDMLELLGNLMDNAYKWAKSQINCSILRDNESKQIILIIEDDGETNAPLKQITQRGVRLDESTEGHGLGLAICKDIVKLYTGTITFSHSKNLHGFCVEIKLP